MARGVFVSAAILLVLLQAAWAHYTSTWAVHIPGGKDAADAVAADHGFVNLGQHKVGKAILKRKKSFL
ncbi:unnamed protein product [Leptosia nina]|uniref:Peptidase S8 pro-domain domain-containing protein n=1 Tax=Leptosia nina TaxID=320188 RepID=A0AAV1J1T4_9NEOP